MYQFVGPINDEKVAGLESLLNCTNENFFTKDDQLLTDTITTLLKQQYNEEANNIYNIDKSKTFNIKNHRFLNEQYFNKEQLIIVLSIIQPKRIL